MSSMRISAGAARRAALLLGGVCVLLAPPFISGRSAARSAVAAGAAERFYQGMRWRMIGPFRGGRTRAAAGVPGEPNVFYVGAVDGGVWKSNDYGRTWRPIFDAEPTQSIGAIAVAPSDPNVVYVASGEGLQRPDLSVGDGIYKSTDAGKTWTHLGLRDGEQIPSLAVDPHDPNRLFAAVLGHPYGPNAERGIFRSTDGGRTWRKVLYKDENVGGSEVIIDSSNPQIVYASLWQARQGPAEDHNDFGGIGGGLFKSVDGGSTWRQLKAGLPANLVQIDFAIAPSRPQRLYAAFSTTLPNDYETGRGMGFYRSDDGGEHWASITADPRPMMKIGGGDTPVVAVDPQNADVVYSTSIVTVRSRDGGKTWKSIRGAPGGDDYQNIWINPGNPKILLLVSDQGAIVTVNGGRTWSSWYNQPTAQLYHVISDSGFPYRVCGAQQESGSVCISSRGNDGEITDRDWHPVGVIEYGYVAPDPLNADIVYGAGRNEVSKFHWSTGQVENVTPIPLLGNHRAERTEPIMFSPVDPRLLYTAANVLFESADGGRTWRVISPDLTRKHPGVPPSIGKLADQHPQGAKQRGAIYSLAPSFDDTQTLWAGTDDGRIWRTHDGGRHWNDVTPPGVVAWSKVSQISASHFDDETAYASVSRMRVDDMHPYIYRTHDSGKTWQTITRGLPDDAPVDTVRADPVRKGLLFAGTEKAVWVSFDDGDQWQSLQLNLPHTSMRDLWIHGDDLLLATHGRSFWILDDITPLRQITPALERSAAHLFSPAPAYRIRRDTNTDTPLPPDEPAGQNPPDGALIDYYLGRRAAGPVSLEILDARGSLVRRYASGAAPAVSAAQLSKQLIPTYWVQNAPGLSGAAGMHRFVWDLRYPAPLSTDHSYPIAAVAHNTPRAPQGPLVLPGAYTVRLSVNGRHFTAPLAVTMDPRVRISAAALARQLQLARRLAAMMSRSAAAVLQARSIAKQLDELNGRAPAAITAAVESLDKKVTAMLNASADAVSGSGPRPATLGAVNGNLNTLYADVIRADAAPTAAQAAAAATLETQRSEAARQWRAIAAADVPELSRELRRLKLAPLRVDPPIRSE